MGWGEKEAEWGGERVKWSAVRRGGTERGENGESGRQSRMGREEITPLAWPGVVTGVMTPIRL